MSELLKRLEGLSPKRLALVALELEEKLAAAGRQRNEPIAVIGMGCRLPGGASSPSAYWDLLASGRDAVCDTPPDRWDNDAYYDADPDAPGRIATKWGGFIGQVDQFDAPFFGISRREANSMDPQQRLLLEVCWEALEDAGISPRSLFGSSTGVFVGMSAADYYTMLVSRAPEEIDAYLATGTAHSIAAGRIAYTLGLHGPNFPVDTACSSSLVAVHLAIQSLRSGESSLALVGGVNLILAPEVSIALSRSHMMAADGRCKAFDARADGFVRGEGCGMVVLKRLSDAKTAGDNILAVLRGSALNQDGRSSGITAPNGAAQERVLRQALNNAGVEGRTVRYIEAHGTGTSLGDPIEAHALAAVYGEGRGEGEPLVVGSVKTNLGHLESAAGVAGLIKVVLSLREERIPAHLHFEKMNPHIDWKGMAVEIPVEGREWKRREGEARRAGVSSFGFSGTNAHVIVEEAPLEEEEAAAEPDYEILTLSARSAGALSELEGRYRKWLPGSEARISDICYTANTGRAGLRERAAYGIRGRQWPEEAFARGRSEGAPEVVFLFTGQGAQYGNMGRELYEQEPVFRKAMERCAEALKGKLQPGLLELLYGNAQDRLNETRYTQPAGFALQYALAELWRSWGVEPGVVLGHSVGEYAAATVAGLYSVEDGIGLIAERGRLSGDLEQGRGGMAAVVAGAARVERALQGCGGRVEIAADNGAGSVVISGRKEDVEKVAGELEGEGIRVERLRVSHGFHSPEMEPIEEAFERAAARVEYGEPRTEIISTVTGALTNGREMGQPGYWRRQLRHRVKFASAVEVLRKRGSRIFVEIGPGSTVIGMGQELLGEKEGQVWAASIRRVRRDGEQMAESAAALWVQGVEVDWEKRAAGRRHRRVALPTYPFERQRYWIERRSPGAAARVSQGQGLLGRRTGAALPVYESLLTSANAPYLQDHRVGGTPVAPASVYLALAASAAADALGAGAIVLRDLVIHEPLLPAKEEEGRLIQTALIPGHAPGSETPVRIYSQADEDGGAGWTLHATAGVAPAGSQPRGDLDGLQARLTKSVDAGAFYAALSSHGIDLGPRCRRIGRLWCGDGMALAELSAGETPAAGLDPALLDGCFQTIGAAVLFGREEAAQNATYVLARAGSITVYDREARCAWAHARVTGDAGEGQGLTAELQIFDNRGTVIVAAENLVLLPMRILPGHAAPSSWFYELEWQLKEQRTAGQKPLSTFLQEHPANALVPELSRLASSHGLNDYRLLQPRVDALIAANAAAALEQLGLHLEPGATLSASAEPAGVAARHSRLFRCLFQILAEDGVLVEAGGSYKVLRAPARLDTGAGFESLQREFPALSAELILTERCSSRLADVLRGQLDPLQLLTSGGSFDVLDRLYTESPAAKTFNGAARAALAAALSALPEGRITALEIGAGTGGTTASLLPALAGACTEYVYTDVSSAFTERARDKFHSYEFLRYTTLDIEREPAEQDLADARFDLVVAANVLHATTDLRRTLRHARKLLRPGGLLLLLEGTRPERWVDVTFGMTEGWWKFSDTGLRPDYPLVSASKWLDLLQEAEFENVQALQPDGGSQQVLLLAGASGRSDPGRWLVWGTPGGAAETAIVERLEGLGSKVKTVASAQATESAVAGGACSGIILTGCLGDTSPQECGNQLVATLQILTRRGVRIPVWAATRGAQPVRRDSSPLYPHQATLWGLGRVAALEYPNLWGGLVDCDPEASPAQWAECVVNEILGDGAEDQVAYHENRRLVPRLAQSKPVEAGGPSIHGDGTYLITGGLGALGLKVAGWLADRGARSLALVGRRALPERSQWGGLASADPMTARCREVEALERRGVEVRLIAADVTKANDIERMRAALSGVRLRGIVHTAAVFGNGALTEVEPQAYAAILAPKIEGTLAIESLASPGELDFLALFSSTTSLIGVSGMGAYAAANQFLDTYAHDARRRGIPAVSINWGTWDEMGSTPADVRQSYLRAGLRPMDSIRALEAFGRVLTSGEPQAVVADIDWSLLKPLYEARRPRPMLSLVSGEKTPSEGDPEQPIDSAVDAFAAGLTAMQPAERLESLLSLVRKEASLVLGQPVQEVDIQQGLFEAGMDSLMSVELKRRLEKRTGLRLPTTLAFNYPNVGALANYLHGRLFSVLPSEETPLPDADAHDPREDLSENELADLLARSLNNES